jgi:hypothetical protein
MFHSVYRGCNIYRTSRKSSGVCWEAYAGGRFIYADTLAGIRSAIRDAVS